MMTYHDIMASVAIRINALDGTDAAELQITYSARPLTNEMFQSSIFPFNAIRDAILNAEQKLAETIAFSADRTLRAYLKSQTSALASGADLPSANTAGDPIIGNFGACLDGTDTTKILTRMPVAVVRNRLLSSAVFLAPVYYYALAGNRLLHTRSTAILECCVYNAETQTTDFNRNDDILLPDSLAEAYINGGLAMLVRDDEFVQQAGQFAGYFATELANIPKAPMEQTAV